MVEQNIAAWLKEGIINTASGKEISLLDPKPEQMDILDMACAMSKICRYGGRLKPFYSVAQHSILVSIFCDRADRYPGFMHDATETYLGDVPKPLKEMLGEVYKQLERRFDAVIFSKFNVDKERVAAIKKFDKEAMQCEFEYLIRFSGNFLEWERYNRGKMPLFIEMVKFAIVEFQLQDIPGINNSYIWAPAVAEQAFLKVFEQLKPE
jgi:hypothetical protein